VKRVIEEYGHSQRVTVTEVDEGRGPECLNCGNVAGPVFPTVCPNCQMREISPCPYCGREIPRQHYIPVSGDLFICPECRRRVRVQTNPEPLRKTEVTVLLSSWSRGLGDSSCTSTCTAMSSFGWESCWSGRPRIRLS